MKLRTPNLVTKFMAVASQFYKSKLKPAFMQAAYTIKDSLHNHFSMSQKDRDLLEAEGISPITGEDISQARREAAQVRVNKMRL